MIRRKLLVGWVASAVLLLVVTGLVFGIMLRSTQHDYIRSDLTKVLGQIGQRLTERQDQVNRAAVLLAARPEVIAGLHLFDAYEDPEAYESLVFDPEKRRLAALTLAEAVSVGVDALGLFGRDGGMVTVYSSGRASGNPPGAAFSTWKDGQRQSVPLSATEGLNHTTGLERLAPRSPPQEPKDRLLTVNTSLALISEAPVRAGIDPLNQHRIGTVLAGRVFGLADIADIVARSGMRAAIVPHGTAVPAEFAGLDLGKAVPDLARSPPGLILQDIGGILAGVAVLPLEDGGQVHVMVAADPPDLGAVLSTYGEASVLVLLPMVLLLIPAGAFALQRWVIAPLEALASAAEAVRRGNAAEVRLAERSDELGSVARAFNAMVADLVARENDLKKSQQSYQELYDYAPAAYATVRAEDGGFQQFNHAFVALLGYSAEELPDLHALDLFAADGVGAVGDAAKAFARFRQGEAVRDAELRMRHRSGGALWVSMTLEPVHGENRQVVEGRLVIIDIDARKRAEEALRQSIDELTRINGELAQFAYVAAHDLREPVRQIVSYTQLLERDLDGGLSDDQRQSMHYITSGARHMYDLIGALLDYAGAAQGAGRLREIDVTRVLSMVMETLRLSIRSAGAKVEIGPMPVVLADDVQLIQVFQNLMSNALKFQPAGRAPHVTVTAEARGADWVFHVTDNGIGFEPEFASRVFEMFERLHPQENFLGTGIGLPICRKIIEANGGRIWATSRPGEGSTFSFLWPAARTVKAMAESAETA